MKIAWFTPLSTRSAIAEYSVHVCAALEKHCHVTIWAGDEQPWRPCATSVLDARGRSLERLTDYDHVVYNLGDHRGFHRIVHEASRRYPGVCVLHDRTYDSLVAEHGRPNVSSVRVAIAGARGVMVHADDHAREVEDQWFGPVGRIQFPVYADQLAAATRTEQHSHPRTVLTVGYAHPNRQIHRVIEIFHRESELREHLRYVVVGPEPNSTYARTLASAIERYELEGSVELVLGYQHDDEFRRYLQSASAFINLREPPSESASASFHTQLAQGKPVIVSDAGLFSEVPENVVIRIPPGDDAALSRALWQLATDEELVRDIGRRARVYASSLTVDRTADGILRFLEECQAWRPLLDLTGRVAAELGMLRANGDADVVDQVATQIAVLARP